MSLGSFARSSWQKLSTRLLVLVEAPFAPSFVAAFSRQSYVVAGTYIERSVVLAAARRAAGRSARLR